MRAYDSAGNNSGNSNNAIGQTLSVQDTSLPSTPSGVSLSNPTHNSLRLNWSASTDNVGVAGYRIDVAINSNFTTIVSGYSNKDVGNVLNSVIDGLSASTTYYARVRAYDAAGNLSNNSSTVNATTSVVPDTQSPSAPGNPNFTNIAQTSLRLNWSASTDNVSVRGYRMDLSTDSAFTVFVTGYNNRDVGNYLYKSISGLTASTTYYARVRAYDAAGNISANSAASARTLSSDTQAPSVPANPNFTNASQNSVTLNWIASTDTVGVAGYKIDVAINSNFTNMVSGYSNLDVGNILTKSVSDLNAATTYYARVRAYDAAGNTSANSAVAQGATTTAGLVMNPIILTSMTEVDPSNAITVSSSCVGFTNLETRSTNSYVYKANQSQGDFFYELDTMITASDTSMGELGIWGVTNTPGAILTGWNNGAYLGWYRNSSIFRLELENRATSTYVNSITLNLNQRYYLRVQRNGITLRLDIFSNPQRTQLLDTRTLELDTNTYNYVYGLATKNSGITVKKASGDVCNVQQRGPAVSGDTQAPTAVSDVTVTNASMNSFRLTWSAATDNVAVTGYRMDVANDDLFANFVIGYNNKDLGNVLSTVVAGVSEDKTYYVRMRAYDAAGNVSTNSGVISATTLADTSAPTVASNVNLSNPTANSLDLSWEESTDNVAVIGYRVDVATDNLFNNKLIDYNNKDVGHLLSMTITGLSAQTTYYARVRAYDASNNTSLNSAVASATTLAVVVLESYVSHIFYTVAGQIERVEYGNGVVTNYEYDANLRLKRILTTNPQSALLQDVTYIYDGRGNVRTMTDSVTGEVKSFTYDHLNRLTQADGRYGAGQTLETQLYAYDPLGNMREHYGASYSYGFNAGPHALTSTGSASFTYDANGNMTQESKTGLTRSFAYDTQNRLTTVHDNAALKATHAYDEAGVRVKKTVGGTTTRYVGELYEKTGTNETRYVFAGGMRVAALASSGATFYHTDHLGSPRVITDAMGQVVDEMDYKPFGEVHRHDSVMRPLEGPSFTDQQCGSTSCVDAPEKLCYSATQKLI